MIRDPTRVCRLAFTVVFFRVGTWTVGVLFLRWRR